MDLQKKAWIGTGVVATVIALTVLPSSPVQALAPPDKDVTVVNSALNPVPVTGSIAVTGSTTVSGSVNSSQSGAWNVGINPLQNTVKVAATPSFFYDSTFSVINDGATVDLGPFDLSGLSGVRLVVRGINGDVHVKVIASVAGPFSIPFDEFTADGESGEVTKTVVYDFPPPSITLRLTESGPGGSNYHVLLIGR